MPFVVLTYDLHGADPGVYAKLDAELKKQQYTKISEDTTWEGEYKAEASVEGALETTKHEFAEAARAAGATKYDLRVYGSPVQMKVTNLTKR